ncbi:MAG: electron transfer flavoprotein subunit beta/FixA family protein [Gammaproteobacteria bacterium]
MKILVPIKRVLDYNIRVRLKTDGSGVETAGAKMVMNPFDEIALEEAIRHKEAGIASEIIAVTIGSQACQETLRSALAMGADRAILIETNAELEPLLIAKLLKASVLKETPQLVLMGKQAVDDDYGQTGQMLAALLNWPQATFASKLIFSQNQVEVTCEMDGGLETLALELPAVVTTDLRLNQPRYITLPNIMKARQKPIVTLPVEQLGVELTGHLKIVKIELPSARKTGTKVGNVQELIEKLRHEAKVLP